MATSASTFDTANAGLVIRPVQPTIGAEIEGVDLSKPLTDELRAAIRAAVLKWKVVFFRDQSIDDAQQAAFAANFGPLYTHPTTQHDAANKEVHAIAAKHDREYEKKLGYKVKPGEAYHSDTSWRLVPTWGAVLRDVNLPEVGGDTIWVDAALAYETLPEELKQRLESKHVTHNFVPALELSGHEYPIVAHKIVRTHRETGQKILWVNFSQQPQILGKREGKALQWASTHVDEFAKVLAAETGLPLPIAKEFAGRGARLPVPIDQGVIDRQQVVLDTFRQFGEVKGDRPLAAAFAPAG